MKKKKIFIAGSENCGLIFNLGQGFKDLNLDVTTAVLQKDPFFTYATYDYDFTRPERKSGFKYFTKIQHIVATALWKLKLNLFKRFRYYEFDHYIFTIQTLERDLSDLEKLKAKNKIITFLFLGSEIRWIEAFRQEFTDNGFKGFPNEDWKSKITLARKAELSSTTIFSVPDASGLLVRGYYHMFMPLDVTGIRFKPKCTNNPYIIHAPSKRDVKGTGLILQAIETLKREGINFTFELVEGLANDQLQKKLEEAEIVIDQLYANGPGTLATEGMAAGCVVAGRFFKEYELTARMPMSYIDEHCLVDELRKLITDLDYRNSLLMKTREFVEKNNNNVVIAQRILASLERESLKDFDYEPAFFREKFVLPKQYVFPAEVIEMNNAVLKNNPKKVIEKEYSSNMNSPQ